MLSEDSNKLLNISLKATNYYVQKHADLNFKSERLTRSESKVHYVRCMQQATRFKQVKQK